MPYEGEPFGGDGTGDGAKRPVEKRENKNKGRKDEKAEGGGYDESLLLSPEKVEQQGPKSEGEGWKNKDIKVAEDSDDQNRVGGNEPVDGDFAEVVDPRNRLLLIKDQQADGHDEDNESMQELSMGGGFPNKPLKCGPKDGGGQGKEYERQKAL